MELTSTSDSLVFLGGDERADGGTWVERGWEGEEN